MFKLIQNIYKENSDRINMLNYAFLLAKIFKMLGLSELTNYLKAVKSKEKKHCQKKTFGNIFLFLLKKDRLYLWFILTIL